MEWTPDGQFAAKDWSMMIDGVSVPAVLAFGGGLEVSLAAIKGLDRGLLIIRMMLCS